MSTTGFNIHLPAAYKQAFWHCRSIHQGGPISISRGCPYWHESYMYFGTVALLANILGRLQILALGKQPTDQDAWQWVRPQPACLIVDLGDAMVEWTGGLLRSNVHCINHAPGLQRFQERYSMAILVRPEKEASMKNLVGRGTAGGENTEGEDQGLTAWEWEVKKAMALKRGDDLVQSKGGKTMGGYAVLKQDLRTDFI